MRLPITFLTLFLFPLNSEASSPLPDGSASAPRGASAEIPLEMGPELPAREGESAPRDPQARREPPRPCPRFDLHAALQLAQTDCLQIALRNMDVNDRDVDGDTPLHNAIHSRNAAAIRLLLRNGADIHLPDFEGRNAMDLAWSLGHHRLYAFLTSLERENERLLEAVDNGDVVAVNASLQRGARLGMRDLRLDTPLHRAAASGLTDVARLLVRHGANLEARNYLGETALHVAARRGFRDFMKMLIEAGANVNALDERRNTPLTIAENEGDTGLVAWLEKKHARRGSPASVTFDFEAADGELVGAPATP